MAHPYAYGDSSTYFRTQIMRPESQVRLMQQQANAYNSMMQQMALNGNAQQASIYLLANAYQNAAQYRAVPTKVQSRTAVVSRKGFGGSRKKPLDPADR